MGIWVWVVVEAPLGLVVELGVAVITGGSFSGAPSVVSDASISNLLRFRLCLAYSPKMFVGSTNEGSALITPSTQVAS